MQILQSQSNFKVTCTVLNIQSSKKNQNWRTVFALMNGMVGSLILILPITYSIVGYFIGSFIGAITCILSYYLTYITYLTLQDYENQQDQSIQRLFGKRMYDFFQIASAIPNIMLGVLFYQLLCDQIYNILQFFCIQCFPLKEQIVFDRFSYQYLSMLMLLVVIIMLYIKNLELIVKISQIGVYATYIYVIYIIYIFFNTEVSSSSNFFFDTQAKLNDYISISLGYFYGYNIQNYFITVIRQNKQQKENLMVLKITFISSYLIYSIIGIAGSLGNKVLPAIINIEPVQTPKTILDFFPKNRITSLFISLILPVFSKSFQVTSNNRNRMFKWKQIKERTINFIVVLGCIFVAVFSNIFSISLLIDLNGGIFTFLTIYFFPILGYLQHKKIKQQKERILKTIILKALLGLGFLLAIYSIALIFIK